MWRLIQVWSPYFGTHFTSIVLSWQSEPSILFDDVNSKVNPVKVVEMLLIPNQKGGFCPKVESFRDLSHIGKKEESEQEDTYGELTDFGSYLTVRSGT